MLTSQATGTSEKSQWLFNQTIQIPVFKHTGIWPSLGGDVQRCHMDSKNACVMWKNIHTHKTKPFTNFQISNSIQGAKQDIDRRLIPFDIFFCLVSFFAFSMVF